MATLTASELRAVALAFAADEAAWRPHVRADRPQRTFHALRRDGPADTLQFGPADIHRVAHVSGTPAVTIHAYSPALRRMGAYVQSPDGVLLRHAMDEDQELRPITTEPMGAPA
jgi:hypothetical protein